ncbi:MAG: c-type cytochrome [Planctomycetota bacterium]|nr:c-type cytochrome [Planctomycetota bacterium]
MAVVVVLAGCSRAPEHPATNGAGTGDGGSVIEAAAELPSGWAATYTAQSGTHAATLTPTASFALEPGQSVHPAIEARAFEASFEGVLTIDRPGTYRFGAEVEGGEASVRVQPPGDQSYSTDLQAGKNATFGAWVDLAAGPVRVVYAFARDGDSRARLRPLWQMQRDGLEGFVDEPIPSRFVRVSTGVAAEAAQWLAVERGRVLLGDLGCVQCHGGQDAVAATRAAPELSHVGQRADLAWLARWIESPQQLKPGSGMPDVVRGSSDDAHALAAYVQSLSSPVEWPAAATEPEVITAGRELYESAGCIACHGTAASNQPAGWSPSYPFGDLTEKWNPAGLSSYLQPPDAGAGAGGGSHHRASMGLTESEADLLATYLVSVWGAGEGTERATDSALISRGEDLFAMSGCASCHDVVGMESQVGAPPLNELDPAKGCLNADDLATPRYVLSDRERTDLREAVRAVQGWAADADAPTDHAHLTIQTLNCLACHDWHGRGGVPEPVRDFFTAEEDADLGDEGRFPPRLEGAGWKLTNTWLGQVIEGGAQARPYMRARMPVFDSRHAHALVDELAQLDGVWPGEDVREPEVTDTMVQGGLKLIGAGGLNCIACHTFGDRPPVGLPGPDIAQFGERLRYDWWQRYVLSPPRFKPGTRMPSYFVTGSSPITTIAEGDPHAQADAMWAYFSLGELFMPAPEGVTTPGGMEVLVRDEPVVMRTFLKDVGARGIAVGFPAGVHFAYDANTSRLRYAWTGSFVDASGAWAGRGGSIVGGQGPTVWTAPDGAAIAINDRPTAWAETPIPSFGGYRFDAAGVPTFLSSLGDVTIAETMRPYPRAGVLFARTIELTGLSPGRTVWVRGGERSELSTVTGGAAELTDGVWRIDAESDRVVLVLEVLP